MSLQDYTLTPALDEFERYYTEKIWDWIPPIYRDEDGLADNPDVLREIVKILANQAAIARRSIDRLWEDQSIELCDDWAIAYLGDLVGTRLVNELNRRGRRVDVARTIFYRRRKGTPLAMERLTQDITGWEGTVVESFKRLGRTHHGLDPELSERLNEQAMIGIITPPGGWANLKSTRKAEQLGEPFEGFAYTPDFRQLRGKLGRYNISKLNFHLYRLIAYPVEFATPYYLGEGRFTFDPSGRDIPLFRPDQRIEVEDWRPPQEWQFPAPISCRLLGNAHYMISGESLAELTIPNNSQLTKEDLSQFVGILFRNEARLRRTLMSLITSNDGFEILFDDLLAGAIASSSPKAYLIPSPFSVDPVAIAITDNLEFDEANESLEVSLIPHQKIVSANLKDWGENLSIEDQDLSLLFPQKEIVIDPERGRFLFPLREIEEQTTPESVWIPIYHYGFSGDVGAGTYDRRDEIATIEPDEEIPSDVNNPRPIDWSLSPLRSGIIQFNDSKTYQFTEDLTNVAQLVLQAKNEQRPYLLHLESDDTVENTTWLIESVDSETDCRSLTLEGLWIGFDSPESTGPSPRPPIPATVILAGNFDQVIIRHCTLDPGGEQAQIENTTRAIPYVQLLVQGTIEELLIESSIVGPILEDANSDPPGTIQQLTVRDSLVHSIDTDTPAIQTRLGTVHLERVTVFGNVFVKELNASEALIQGLVRVTDNQNGCFRFSATNDQPATRLPHQFESHLFTPEIPNLFFVSQRFGDPGYGQLSEIVPVEIVRGAENRSEIGVFSSLLNPIKQDDLNAKVNEFMPFGLIAQFIKET